MTCIIGMEHQGTVYMGGDSAGVSGMSMQIRTDTKVFKNGELLIGFTSSFRMGQLLRFCFSAPERPCYVEDMEYLVSRFIPSVRSCFREGGYLQKDKESEYGGRFLLGYKKRLYEIDDDFQVGQVSSGIASVGCGADIALGVMHALDNSPRERIFKALAITQHLNAGVRAPFTVLSSDDPA